MVHLFLYISYRYGMANIFGKFVHQTSLDLRSSDLPVFMPRASSSEQPSPSVVPQPLVTEQIVKCRNLGQI